MPHRHGYKGRKLHRETDQRRSLMKSLASSLIDHTSIETTHAKAKELIPYVEKLVTKAKKGDLHNRRQIIQATQTISSANKLMDEIAPKLGSRNSGHFRIAKTKLRRGDNAQMSKISFVDDLNDAPVALSAKPESAKQNATKTDAQKKKVAKVK